MPPLDEDPARDAAKQQEIPRSLAPLDYSSFSHVFGLMSQRPWLEHRAKGLIALWNSCEDDEERTLVSELILRFDYLYGHVLDAAYARAMNHVVAIWALSPKDTLFVAITGDTSPDGSQAVIQGLKSKIPAGSKWSEGSFLTRITDLKEKRNLENKTIVLVEDFLGTGNKFFKQLKAVNLLLNELGVEQPKIRLLTIAAMEKCREQLESNNVLYFCDAWLKRGISDHKAGPEIPKAIATMKKLEGRLMRRFDGQWLPHLGYGKSESLVYFEAISIPNNVFPIFWWPKDFNRNNRSPMFTRAR